MLCTAGGATVYYCTLLYTAYSRSMAMIDTDVECGAPASAPQSKLRVIFRVLWDAWEEGLAREHFSHHQKNVGERLTLS